MSEPPDPQEAAKRRQPSIWRNRWVRGLGWALLTVVGYFVIYPALVQLIFPFVFGDSGPPDWVQESLEKTAIPLIWLYENWEPYTKFVEVMTSLLSR